MAKASKAPPKAAPKKAAPDAPLSKFQKFEPARWQRAQIKGADYNPRSIDEWSRKKLKDGLKKMGLANALVVNKRTGNLVSGHQRLSILDDLHGGEPYALDVNVIDVTPARERAMNVMFNNQSVQGTWDFGKLADLLKAPGVDLADTGFDLTEVQLMFEGSEWETMFSPAAQPEAASDMQTLGEMAGAGKPEGGIRDPERHAEVKAERERMRERMAAAQDAKDHNFYVIVVMGSAEEREALMAGLGEMAEQTMVDGRKLCHRLGIPLPKTEAA